MQINEIDEKIFMSKLDKQNSEISEIEEEFDDDEGSIEEDIIIEENARLGDVIAVQILLCVIIIVVVTVLKFNRNDIYQTVFAELDKNMKISVDIKEIINELIAKVLEVINV